MVRNSNLACRYSLLQIKDKLPPATFFASTARILAIVDLVLNIMSRVNGYYAVYVHGSLGLRD